MGGRGAPEKSFRHPTHRRCRCRSFLDPGVVDHSRLASHHRPTAHATFVSTTIETAPPGLSSPNLVVDPPAPCALSTTLQTRCGQGFLATAGVEDATEANHPRSQGQSRKEADQQARSSNPQRCGCTFGGRWTDGRPPAEENLGPVGCSHARGANYRIPLDRCRTLSTARSGASAECREFALGHGQHGVDARRSGCPERSLRATGWPPRPSDVPGDTCARRRHPGRGKNRPRRALRTDSVVRRAPGGPTRVWTDPAAHLGRAVRKPRAA